MQYFQIVLKNSQDKIRIEIFGWIQIQLNTDPKHCSKSLRPLKQHWPPVQLCPRPLLPFHFRLLSVSRLLAPTDAIKSPCRAAVGPPVSPVAVPSLLDGFAIFSNIYLLQLVVSCQSHVGGGCPSPTIPADIPCFRSFQFSPNHGARRADNVVVLDPLPVGEIEDPGTHRSGTSSF